ncbi:hypothetical protein AVEN_136592-1 [Araneus ventricosus]|uniref:Uncharacterized protein n=1 Tax=Araneus ventricosus TaxID=182803 RepID=A0A4Y2WWE9_ARAVE|nr:hypothetical protein AVEN_136592-1 [Araneus ventricosus]
MKSRWNLQQLSRHLSPPSSNHIEERLATQCSAINVEREQRKKCPGSLNAAIFPCLSLQTQSALLDAIFGTSISPKPPSGSIPGDLRTMNQPIVYHLSPSGIHLPFPSSGLLQSYTPIFRLLQQVFTGEKQGMSSFLRFRKRNTHGEGIAMVRKLDPGDFDEPPSFRTPPSPEKRAFLKGKQILRQI